MSLSDVSRRCCSRGDLAADIQIQYVCHEFDGEERISYVLRPAVFTDCTTERPLLFRLDGDHMSSQNRIEDEIGLFLSESKMKTDYFCPNRSTK